MLRYLKMCHSLKKFTLGLHSKVKETKAQRSTLHFQFLEPGWVPGAWLRSCVCAHVRAHAHTHTHTPPMSLSHTHTHTHTHVTSRAEQMWKLEKYCWRLSGTDLLPAASARLAGIPVGSAPASQACSDFFHWWWGPPQSCDCTECSLLDLKDCGKSQSHLAGEESWLCLCQLRGPNISGLIAVSREKTQRRLLDSGGSWEGCA